jgi:hypothetical protein
MGVVSRFVGALSAVLALGLVFAAFASADYTGSQCRNTLVGNSVSWAPDNDVAAWRNALGTPYNEWGWNYGYAVSANWYRQAVWYRVGPNVEYTLYLSCWHSWDGPHDGLHPTQYGSPWSW